MAQDRLRLGRVSLRRIDRLRGIGLRGIRLLWIHRLRWRGLLRIDRLRRLIRRRCVLGRGRRGRSGNHRADPTQGLNQLEKLTTTEQGADLAAPLLVLAELRRGDVPKAASIAEDLVKRNPDDPIILNLLGSVRMAQERLPDAEAIFRDITKNLSCSCCWI